MRNHDPLKGSAEGADQAGEAQRRVALVHNAQLGAHANGTALAQPGAATRSSALSPGRTAGSMVQVHRSIASAECDVTNLEAANRSGDFARASWAQASVERFILQIPQLRSMAQHSANGELAPLIQSLKERAHAALDNAPKISAAARTAAQRGDYAPWNADVAPWLAKASPSSNAPATVESAARAPVPVLQLGHDVDTTPSADATAHADVQLHADATRPADGTAHRHGTSHTQAGHAKHADWRALGHKLEQSAIQLKVVSAHLADWKLNYLVGPAIHWVNKHRDVIAATPDKTLDAWAPTIAAQSATLFEASGDIASIVATAKQSHIRPDAPEAAPYRDVLKAFALAIGEAHLSQDPQSWLEAARRAQAQLPLELLDQSLRTNRALTLEMAATVPNVKDAHGVNHVENARAAVTTLDISALELRQRFNADGKIDSTAVEAIATSAGEQMIIARTAILEAKIGRLRDAADGAMQGFSASNANFFNDDIRNLSHTLTALLPEVSAIATTMRREAIPQGPFPADPTTGQQMFATSRQRAVARANAALAKLSESHKLEPLLQRAVARVEHAQRNTQYFQLVVDIAEMIGIAVISDGLATGASSAARGALLAGAAVDSAEFARTAQLARGVGAATRVTADVTAQSLGQMVVDGHSSFGENALTNLITLGVLQPFHSLVGNLGQLDAESRGLWKIVSGGKVILAESGKLTVETLVGAGASYVATRMIEGKAAPDAITAASWAAQGASIAVGKFVHGRMQSLNERWAHIEQDIALTRRAREQERLAENLEKTGSTEAALYILEEHAQILQQEHALLSDPAALQRLHLDSKQIGALRRGNAKGLNETQSQAFAIMRLRFHGLEPLSNTGDLWSGTRTQIDSMRADAGGAVHDFVSVGNGQWTARVAGHDVKFVEISHWDVDPKQIKRVPQKGEDGHEYQYDYMRPGPLSDRSKYGHGDSSEPLPAQNFYGGKYDEVVLAADTILYRIGNAEQEWGQWYTDHLIECEAHYRMDLAVMREWLEPGTGKARQPARGEAELELWSYSMHFPKGTKLYSGQAGGQGGAFMGGLESGSKQYFVPKAISGVRFVGIFRPSYCRSQRCLR